MSYFAKFAALLALVLVFATVPPSTAEGSPAWTDRLEAWADLGRQLHTEDGARSSLDTAQDAIEEQREARHVERLGLGSTLDAAERLLETTPGPVLGEPATASAPGSPALPSTLVGELLERHDRAIPQGSTEELEALDRLEPDVRRALSSLLAAFLAFEEAGSAYVDARSHAPQGVSMDEAHRELQRLQSREEIGLATAQRALAETGLSAPTLPVEELDRVLETRNRMVAASLALEESLDARAETTSTSSPVVDLCPTVAISISNEGSTYEEDCLLIVDAGGPDRYINNAGGTNMVDRQAPCSSFSTPQDNNATALVDLGEEEDQYGDPADPVDCGANGGGWVGVGFLLDGGGDDVYVTGEGAGNGGGYDGVGSLVDLGGDDLYRSGQSANAASFIGAGALYDARGNDTYHTERIVANGAGLLGAAAALVDAAGRDRYIATESTVNGAGSLGTGAIVDASGDDLYRGEARANGGGLLGVGSLVDGSGDDRYEAGGPPSNGAGRLGAGLLLDGAGEDRYEEFPDRSAEDKTVLPKGTLGAQIDAPNDPSEYHHSIPDSPAQGQAQPHVIVGVGDDGINPYHETFYRPGLTEHPCTYIRAFPCSVEKLDLTLPADPATSVETVDEAYEKDSEEWNRTEAGELFWIPKTPFVAVTCQGDAGPGCAFGTDHGPKTTGNVLSENPDALLGFVAGDGDVEPLEAFGVPVDLYSVSFGNVAPVPMPGGPCPLAEDAPIYVTSAGNDPYSTLASCWKGNPRVVTVGGAYAADDTEEAQAAKQPEVVSYYCRPVVQPGAVHGTITDCGTSFGTPTVAGALSDVVLELRGAQGYTGSVATDQVAPGVTVSDLRDALNRTASYDPDPRYNSTSQASQAGNATGVPLNPVAPWLQWGWGFYDALVAEDTLQHLRDNGYTHPAKPVEAEAYMTGQHLVKQTLYSER